MPRLHQHGLQSPWAKTAGKTQYLRGPDLLVSRSRPFGSRHQPGDAAPRGDGSCPGRASPSFSLGFPGSTLPIFLRHQSRQTTIKVRFRGRKRVASAYPHHLTNWRGRGALGLRPHRLHVGRVAFAGTGCLVGCRATRLKGIAEQDSRVCRSRLWLVISRSNQES